MEDVNPPVATIAIMKIGIIQINVVSRHSSINPMIRNYLPKIYEQIIFLSSNGGVFMFNTGQTAVFLRDLTGKEYPAIAEINRKKRVIGQRELCFTRLSNLNFPLIQSNGNNKGRCLNNSSNTFKAFHPNF